MARTNASRSLDTVVIGAGQCGLTMSRYLSAAGREHVVLDRRQMLGGGWQDRWDEFCLVSPNWTSSLLDYPYDGADPDAYMPRDAIIKRIAAYAVAIDAPVQLDTAVTRLSTANGDGFLVETSDGPLTSRRVVVATGGYHKPRIPEFAPELPSRMAQLHSHEYRNERALPPGAVLIVGSGQTGVQLAEELTEAGRRVYLSAGTAAAIPRRYRGRDIMWWLSHAGQDRVEYHLPFPTPDTLPNPAMRLAAVPQLTGRHGGHDIGLRRLAWAGVQLLGRIERVDGERLTLAPDLQVNLARAEGFFDAMFRDMIDGYIAAAGIDAPPDDRTPFGFDVSAPAELNLADAGITTAIFASGYRPDFGWIDLPIVDAWGMPKTDLGVSDVPGLYFLGLPWQSTILSGNLLGMGWDAAYLADRMGLPRSEVAAAS